MIILKDVKLIQTKFFNEQEVEDLVIKNSEHFFGPSSIFISKTKIKTQDGVGTIPDGFAIDLANRVWYVVEAELGHHSVWTHIAPQVTKQLLASGRQQTRQLLTEIVIQMVTSDQSVKEKFQEEDIQDIDIRKVLNEIFEKSPIIGMPIDNISKDLRDWAETLRNDVKLWIVKKYAKFGDSSVIAYDIPEEYKPVVDTSERDINTRSGIQTFDVTLNDIIDSGLLAAGDILNLNYKPRGGEQTCYSGELLEDGSIKVLGQVYSSLSYAALACIQDAGSERKTINGWISWKAKDGTYLSQLRDEFLRIKEQEAEQKSTPNH